MSQKRAARPSKKSRLPCFRNISISTARFCQSGSPSDWGARRKGRTLPRAPGLLIGLGHQVERGQPWSRAAVRGRPPIAPRRQRSARTDLGCVRDRAALELAQLKEPMQEDSQVRLDRTDPVLVTERGGNVGPCPATLVVPCTVGEERDFGRRVAEA